MEDATHDTLEGLSERLAVIARRLGELTLTHERLARRRAIGDGGAAAASEPAERTDGDADPDEALERQDRIAYLETARSTLYRLLFVVDFSLAHDRVDRALLADARTTLVHGVDAVDACLMLDGVGLMAYTSDE